jgi:hypothetical protein
VSGGSKHSSHCEVFMIYEGYELVKHIIHKESKINHNMMNTKYKRQIIIINVINNNDNNSKNENDDIDNSSRLTTLYCIICIITKFINCSVIYK